MLLDPLIESQGPMILGFVLSQLGVGVGVADAVALGVGGIQAVFPASGTSVTFVSVQVFSPFLKSQSVSN